jgi:hypothetical protein
MHVCRYPEDRLPLHTSIKLSQRTGRAPTRRHVTYSTRRCLPVKVGSRVATCPVTLDPTFLIGRAPTPSCVLWLRTLPPYNEGLRCPTCPTAPDPASLQERAPVRHVSCSSGSYLLTGEDTGPPHVLRLRILPPYREGSDAAIACPAVPCRPCALNIKKSLAGLFVRLGPRVPNSRTHVCKASDVMTIMGLQDVRADSAVNACKTCEHAATVQCCPC